MRNIPFAFLNEETIDQITIADKKHEENVNAFQNLAETQRSMRGVPTDWARGLVRILEKLMAMDGPNSIANLERAMRRTDESSTPQS